MSKAFDAHRVGQIPQIYYLPDFISEQEEQRFTLESLSGKTKWVELSGRRLQNHGGAVHAKGLIPAPMPRWLQPLLARLHERTSPIELYGSGAPNHVLLNAYEPGQGIMPHEDGPAYHPGVCILSLGSPAVIHFKRKTQDEELQGPGDGGPPLEGDASSLLLMPRSLLIFKDEAYTCCTHGIEEVVEERLDSQVCNLHLCPAELAALQPEGVLRRAGTRLSLTVRRVPRVIKGFTQLAAQRL